MKRFLWLLCLCVFVPLNGRALTFEVSSIVPTNHPDVLRILPRGDLLQDPGAVLLIHSDIAQLTVHGPVLFKPRRVRGGFILFVPQGTDELKLNAPLYAEKTVRFSPLRAGQHYELTVTPREDAQTQLQAARQANILDLDTTHIKIELDFDYMEIPSVVKKEPEYNALVYLDKTLNFKQWKKLFRRRADYKPFDVNGNQKEPCCILVRSGEPVENIFKLRVLEWDSYVEYFEGGNTYHTTLTLMPKE